MNCDAALAALSWADTGIAGDTRITATEFLVLCNIARGCRTRAEIAKASGCGQSTVPRAVRRLIEVGALTRQGDPGKANAYTIKPRDTGVIADTGIATVSGSSDTGITSDTRLPVDKPPRAYISTRARADTQKTNTYTRESSSERAELEGESFALLPPDKPSKPDKRGGRMSPDWKPGPSALKLASQLGIVNGWAEATVENFIDYWLGVPGAKGIKCDWDATFRNELRKEAKAKRHKPQYSPNEITIHDQSTRADFASNVRTPKVNASTAILLAQMQGGDRPRR